MQVFLVEYRDRRQEILHAKSVGDLIRRLVLRGAMQYVQTIRRRQGCVWRYVLTEGSA
jgi:hypothetical protein